MASVSSSEQQLAWAKLSHMGHGCRLLELPVQISNAELVALLDYGAMHNFISLGLVEQLELTWQLVSPSTVTMANNQVAITDKAVMVPLKFGPNIKEVTFLGLTNLIYTNSIGNAIS